MLEIKNIYKSFGNLQVLKDISLSIGKGEIVAIVGPSGAGKTTLLQIAGSGWTHYRHYLTLSDRE